MIAEVVFWSSLGFVAHTYLLYPLAVAMLGRRRTGAPPPSPGDAPSVSVVVAVHNEEACIRQRVENLLASSYPPGGLEVLIGSDGSTDRTNEILSGVDSGMIRAFLFRQRRGKAAVLNDLLRDARGEIVVFSDANTNFTPVTIAELVRPFADPSVGAVTGELILRPPGRDAGTDGEVSYWRFENWLRHAESDAGTTLGASGGVYAIRRELWRPLPSDKGIVDDFLVTMNVLKAGRVVRYHRAARAYERSTGSVGGEFRRKVRIGASNFNGIPEFKDLLHPRHGFVSFALWSHKILRWFVPFFLIAIGITSFLLGRMWNFYGAVAACSAVLVVLSIPGLIGDRLGWRLGPLGLPYYFLAMNGALFVGFFRSLAGRQTPEWRVVR